VPQLLDRKIVAILAKYYRKGRYDSVAMTYIPPVLSTAEQEALRASGVQPGRLVKVRHDEALDRLREAIGKADRERIGAAFVASLGSHPLVYRAALRSYAVGAHMPRHSWTGRDRNPTCEVCGMAKSIEVDLVQVEAQRYLSGIAGFTEPFSAAYDLELFDGLPPAEPVKGDRDTLRQLLKLVHGSSEKETATQLVKKSSGLTTGDQYVRSYPIETLGYCGVLETPEHKGFFKGHVAFADRQARPHARIEMEPPAAWWRGKYGINEEALAFFLGRWV
jgi:hypothetical protein